MKKILICNYRGDIVSGAEKAIVDMVLPLKEYFDFTMFVPSEDKLSKFYRSKGLKVLVKKLSNKRRIYPGLHSLDAFKLSRFLVSKKFDLLLCNTFYAAEKISTVSKFSKIPMVIFTREYFDTNIKSYRRNLDIAKRIFAVSNDVKESLIKKHQDIVVTHDYIKVNDLVSKEISPNNIPSNYKDSFKVVVIGRVTPYKQQDLFVDSYDYLAPFSKPIEYYVVGESSNKEKYYFDSLINKSVGKDIHFLGNRNDVYDILPLFDISCMVSDREPFPRTILESQYLKVPVVASNTGGALEMIVDYDTGLFFNVKDKNPKILANKICELLSSKELSQRIVNNAYENLFLTVASNQPIDNFKRQIEDVIKDFE